MSLALDLQASGRYFVLVTADSLHHSSMALSFSAHLRLSVLASDRSYPKLLVVRIEVGLHVDAVDDAVAVEVYF